MDAYPREFVQDNVPLYVLAGMDVDETPLHPLQQNGPRIGADTVQIQGSRGKDIVDAFARVSSGQVSADSVPDASFRARFRTARMQYSLPARKASPQASMADSIVDVQSLSSSSQSSLYSPLSPLCQGSPLHPDGLMTHLWLARYQQMVPSVFISFFEIIADPNTDSLRDNQLKNEIAAIRSSIEDSRYRTRFAVVLVGNESVVNGPELEERVINIRRAARLDEKCLFFLDSKVGKDELARFASNVVSAMQPYALEFYRDLTRHTRRKRDKGGNPSHAISRLGWISRYEFKLGIYAEFRGEPEVAERHFNSSMMALFDAQGPFETLSSWSPRWTEARIWADTTFVRLIRSQLAIRAPTTAVRSWTRHRDRMHDLLDRKAKGTENYGFMAWEARWSRIMADLTRAAPMFVAGDGEESVKGKATETSQVFVPAEKSLTQETQQPPVLNPWQFLHHAGYWLRRSVKYTRRRLELALELPDEYRMSPAQSPASSVARRNEAYDMYLAPDPHLEWYAARDQKGAQALDIVSGLGRATGDFQMHRQYREADHLRLELSQQGLEAGQTEEALSLLKPLLKRTRWRAEQWRMLLQQLLLTVHKCSIDTRDLDMLVAAQWELASTSLPPLSDFQYDIMRSLATPADTETDTSVVKLDNTTMLSCLNLIFSLGDEPAFVGERLMTHLLIKYDAHECCAPIVIDTISVDTDGKIPGFTIKNDAEAEQTQSADLEDTPVEVQLEKSTSEGSAQLSGRAALNLRPGQTKIFNVTVIPDEAGSCKLVSILSTIKASHSAIEYTTHSAIEYTTWPTSLAEPQKAQFLGSLERTLPIGLFPPRLGVEVQPRPPKLTITIPDLRNIYYTDEVIKATLQIFNGENEQADVQLHLRLRSDTKSTPDMHWVDSDDLPTGHESGENLTRRLGTIEPGITVETQVELESLIESNDMILEALAVYTVPSSAGRKINRLNIVDVVVIRPFEATQQIFADYHAEHWPNYFHYEDDIESRTSSDCQEADVDKPQPMHGFKSRWQYRAKIVSFATDTLILKNVRLSLTNIKRAADIRIVADDSSTHEIELVSNGQHTVAFTIDIRKRSMDDTSPVAMEPLLEINWQRVSGSQTAGVCSGLPLTRLSLAGAEPRVLARQLPSDKEGTTVVEYVLENPSMHFLTFSLSVEPNEEFAFSGPKTSKLNLTPLSRHGVKYLFAPYTKGAHISPEVRVVDLYFNKVLSVTPVGDLRTETGELKVYISEAG